MIPGCQETGLDSRLVIKQEQMGCLTMLMLKNLKKVYLEMGYYRNNKIQINLDYENYLLENKINNLTIDVINKINKIFKINFIKNFPDKFILRKFCQAITDEQNYFLDNNGLMVLIKKPFTYSTQCLVTAGANVCERLKNIFPEIPWPQIFLKFNEVKNKLRNFYPHLDDLLFLKELMNLPDEDLRIGSLC
jgi:hypothetical protein